MEKRLHHLTYERGSRLVHIKPLPSSLAFMKKHPGQVGEREENEGKGEVRRDDEIEAAGKGERVIFQRPKEGKFFVPIDSITPGLSDEIGSQATTIS